MELLTMRMSRSLTLVACSWNCFPPVGLLCPTPYESVCFLFLHFVMFFTNYVKMSLNKSPTFHHIDSPCNTFLQWSHIAQFDQNEELWGKRDLFRLLWGMEWSSLCPYHLTIIPGLSCGRVCSQSTPESSRSGSFGSPGGWVQLPVEL